jgi:hypothetical protein
MFGIRTTRWAAALCNLGLGLCSTFAWAEPAPSTIRGEVKSFTTAPKGETDGALLTGGDYVHWPPHAGERIAAIVKVGDSLESAGRWETGPEGDRRFEADRVVNTATKASVEIERRGPAPRPGAKPRRGETTTKNGRVVELTTAPKGEVDGAKLSDGTTIHWPPHLEARFRKIATVGTELRAVGTTETTPKGDLLFEVQSLTNVDTNQTVAGGDGPPAPRAPRGESAGRVKESRDERLHALQRRLDEIQRELDELRHEE